MSDRGSQIPIRPNIKVLVINSLEQKYDPTEIQDFITSNEHIDGWWNHFPGVWLIETKLTSRDLAKVFYDAFDGISCFVTSVNTGDFSGRMSGDAWLWLMMETDERKERLREALKKRQEERNHLKIEKSK